MYVGIVPYVDGILISAVGLLSRNKQLAARRSVEKAKRSGLESLRYVHGSLLVDRCDLTQKLLNLLLSAREVTQVCLRAVHS